MRRVQCVENVPQRFLSAAKLSLLDETRLITKRTFVLTKIYLDGYMLIHCKINCDTLDNL